MSRATNSRTSSAARKTSRRWIRGAADELAVHEGCWFDEAAAARVVQFFARFLRHSKGEWAGQPFELLDWQRDDIVYPLFGWRRADGTRRYRKAYIEIPKKNGKSTLSAGISIYLLVADGEPGAEIYSAAADRDQAGIVYKEAASMVRASPELASRLVVRDSVKTIGFAAERSWYKVLSSEAAGAEGKNIHGLVFDELHAQRSRQLWDALTYGGASRRQPLLVAITTAGSDTDSICYEQHEYAEKVLAGADSHRDSSFFGYIAAADPKDDWRKESTWRKANPSYGITIKADAFAADCLEAQAEPRKENPFKRYRLNIWTAQETRWIQMERWAACHKRSVDVEQLLKRPCFGGLDLSTKFDLSALVLWFPPALEGEPHQLLSYFWLPAETVKRHEQKHNDVPYRRWVDEGFIEETPGNVIDYGFIRERINALSKQFTIRQLAFDPYNATHLVQELQADGIAMKDHRQGYLSMSPPSKEFEKLIVAGELEHGDNPVLTWMAGNVAVDSDKRGNIAPVKPKPNSPKKIDGIVASVMALGLLIADPVEVKKPSVYETRGLRKL